MLAPFFGKIYTTVLSFSILLFSNYIGNDPIFTNIYTESLENGIFISGYLESAYDNDFDDIFSSGIQIEVTFDLSVSHRNNILLKQSITNSVVWDSEFQYWIIQKEENPHSVAVNDILSLRHAMSSFETFLEINTTYYNVLDINISARLPVIYVAPVQKDIDLMILWKLKEPKARLRLNILEI